MQRYTTRDIVDLVPDDKGELVLHSEAQAEIDRLKAEVATMRAAFEKIEMNQSLADCQRIATKTLKVARSTLSTGLESGSLEFGA